MFYSEGVISTVLKIITFSSIILLDKRKYVYPKSTFPKEKEKKFPLIGSRGDSPFVWHEVLRVNQNPISVASLFFFFFFFSWTLNVFKFKSRHSLLSNDYKITIWHSLRPGCALSMHGPQEDAQHKILRMNLQLLMNYYRIHHAILH